MVVRVVAGSVAFFQHSAKEVSMTLDVFANAKECRCHVITSQRFQHKFCGTRNRAVVKGKIEVVAFGGQAPLKGGIQQRQDKRRSVRYHSTRHESMVISS